MSLFFWKKSKRQQQTESLVEENKQLQRKNLAVAEENAEQGKKNLAIAADNIEIGKSLDAKSGRLVNLIEKNDGIKESLDKREAAVREQEKDLDERQKEIRKQEIEITARKADVRRQESEADRRDRGMDDERSDIKKREQNAKKIANDSRAAKENCDAKQQKLDEWNIRLKEQEKQLQSRIEELDTREKKANAIFDKAKAVDAELTEKQRLFDEKCAGIEQALQKKVDEYDRKLADIEAAGDTVASIKLDNSEEGKRAKIVVQEAIRQAKKNLEDGAHAFGELQERYCQGTFRGFSTPLKDITHDFENLKDYAKQIHDDVHNQNIAGGEQIVEDINERILKAEKCLKSWEFSDAFRHICYGLATCENYALLLRIIMIMQGAGEPEDDARSGGEPDYYEILGVSENASDEEIKRAHKRKAQEYHSDKHPDASDDRKRELDEKMAQINKAREVLLDKDKRSEYDSKRKSS